MTETDNNTPSETITEQAYLIADVGHTNTTVSLIDVAVGGYRLLASATVHTTIAEPWADVSQGILQAVQRIIDRTGRKLLNDRGEIIRPTRRDGTGVDFFTAAFSAAPLLKTMIVGLSDDVSLHAARRVLAANYTDIVCQFSLSDSGSTGAQLQTFLEARPDLVFIAGGTDGGATNRLLEIIDSIQLGTNLIAPSQKPDILFAGNKELREQIIAMFGAETTVHVAENIHPTLTAENLDSAITLVSEFYKSQKIHTLQGMREILEWNQFPFLPTAHAFAAMVEYLAALHQGQVVGVDLGSGSLTLITATGNQTNIHIRTDLGMGNPITEVLSSASSTDINRWLPSPLHDEEILNFVHNKALFPHTIPITEQTQNLELAVAREMLRQTIADLSASGHKIPPFRLLVARGATLTNAQKPGQTVLALLDALEPTGIFSIVLDKNAVLPALGIIAPHNPLVAVQSLENGALSNTGWVIAPAGKGTIGQKAVSITLESDNKESLQIDVPYGTVERLPLPPGQAAKATIKPGRRFDVGFGPGKSKTVTLHGGTLGIVIDARGRPLSLTRKDAAAHELMQQWLHVLGE